MKTTDDLSLKWLAVIGDAFARSDGSTRGLANKLAAGLVRAWAAFVEGLSELLAFPAAHWENASVDRPGGQRVVARTSGKTALTLSPVGLGCWQFSGGKGIGAYWEAIPQATIDDIVATALARGVTWFDTAEAYGSGESERRLATALTRAGAVPGQVVVATKWQPVGRTASSILSTIEARLAALKPWPIDLHQVHQPWGFSTVEAEMQAMADLVDRGKIRAVGVSNFDASQTRRAHRALAERGVALASNQVKYNLLDRHIERDGTLEAAKELGVTIIAYSPLEQGLLTGRFHDHPGAAAALAGPRRFFPRFKGGGLERSRAVVEQLRAIAAHHGATCSQVALAWLIQFHRDSVVVIPGATRVSQVEDNAKSMAVALRRAELDALDSVSRRFL